MRALASAGRDQDSPHSGPTEGATRIAYDQLVAHRLLQKATGGAHLNRKTFDVEANRERPGGIPCRCRRWPVCRYIPMPICNSRQQTRRLSLEAQLERAPAHTKTPLHLRSTAQPRRLASTLVVACFGKGWCPAGIRRRLHPFGDVCGGAPLCGHTSARRFLPIRSATNGVWRDSAKHWRTI